MEFNCRVCLKTGLRLSEMKQDKRFFTSNMRKGLCKKCINEYETNRQLERRAIKSPEDYMQCDDCDKTFKTTNRGNINKIELLYRKCCPHCKSHNIINF